MKTVRVEKDTLIERVRLNRENHREKFEEALQNYRKAVIRELERKLDDVTNGRKIDRAIRLVEPQDHTDDYDQVLTMLDMSLDDTIELDFQDFRAYVMDEWGWIQQFVDSYSSYTTKEYTDALGKVKG